MILFVISGINNFLRSFDILKEVNNDATLECFLYDVNPNVEIEKPFSEYIQTIFKYIIYFIFFYNIDDPISIIEMYNYN